MSGAADLAKLFVSGDGDKPVDVPVEHLDYDYVGACTDSKELVAILQVLRSGKEGKYQHLEDFVEKRLLDVLPPAQRKCVHRCGRVARRVVSCRERRVARLPGVLAEPPACACALCDAACTRCRRPRCTAAALHLCLCVSWRMRRVSRRDA
jgi:hypothetical protein